MFRAKEILYVAARMVQTRQAAVEQAVDDGEEVRDRAGDTTAGDPKLGVFRIFDGQLEVACFTCIFDSTAIC